MITRCLRSSQKMSSCTPWWLFGPAILVAAPAMLVAMPALWMMGPDAMALAKMPQAITVRQWYTAHEEREHGDPSQ